MRSFDPKALTSPQRVTFGGDGIALVGDAYGVPGDPPVLLLHGGGQTRHAWGDTAAALAGDGFFAVALDLRGHGESDWSPDGRYDSALYLEDTRRVVDALGAPPILVGASLGGMIGLTFAGLYRPQSLAGLVLVDVAHDVVPAGVARVIDFMESGQAGFATLDEAADAVARYLPHRKRPASLEGLRKNLRMREDGRWYWHWDPRLLESADIGELRRSGRFTEAARNIRVPVLLVRGRESDVIDERIAAELLALIPHARAVDVAGARHMIAGDRNDAFGDAVRAFARDVSGRAG